MMASFTPGPWSTTSRRGCKSIYGARLCEATSEVAYTTGLYDDGEDEANARLIAAAPELFDALRALRSALSSGVEVTQSVLPKVDAVIARVRGDA